MFVIPGLILTARMVPVMAAAVSGDRDVAGTIKWSWSATRNVQGAIALAMVVPFVCVLLAIAAILHWEFFYLETPEVWPAYEWGSALLVNTSLSVALIWMSALGAIVYGDISRLPTDEKFGQAPR